jgi:RHS repeat-associated protein
MCGGTWPPFHGEPKPGPTETSAGFSLDGTDNLIDAPPAGNRLSRQDYQTGTTSNFAYDAIYQLLQVTQSGQPTETYSYDDVGNRLSSLGVSPYSYDNSNELNSQPGVTYSDDANGNLISKTDATGTTTYAWDVENRLTSVALPASGGTVTYQYDPFGRRIEKISATGTTIYAYDGDNVVEELDGGGTAEARYAQGLGIDEPLAMYRGGASYYYNADGLGSITSLTNASGQIAASYTYDSFGKLTASNGTVANPFRYTGREYGSDTGLYYYRARYYDSLFGRFLSEDPSETSGAENLFVYVTNNPVNQYDPMGLRGKKPKKPEPSPNAVYYICCQKGEVKVCNKNGDAFSGWVADCMRQHEQQHIKDLTCGGENPCEGQPNGPLLIPTSEASQTECNAYRKELECLRPAPFTKEIQDRRKFIQKQIDNYCGGR